MKLPVSTPQSAFVPSVLVSRDAFASFAYKHVRQWRLSWNDQEDCAADFTLHFLQHSFVSTPAYPPAFLNRCAFNFVSNFCRNRSRRLYHEIAWPQQIDVDGETIDCDFADCTPAPAALLIQQEAKERIYVVMQALTPLQQRCIVRHYLHNESYTEIAAQMLITADAVRMCIMRGLNRLRTLLNEQGMDEAEAFDYLTEIGRCAKIGG